MRSASFSAGFALTFKSVALTSISTWENAAPGNEISIITTDMALPANMVRSFDYVLTWQQVAHDLADDLVNLLLREFGAADAVLGTAFANQCVGGGIDQVDDQ